MGRCGSITEYFLIYPDNLQRLLVLSWFKPNFDVGWLFFSPQEYNFILINLGLSKGVCKFYMIS